jgi:hypothetical protein
MIWLLLALVALCADWSQTRWIADHPGFTEMNPYLGAHPSIGRVNVYFALALVVLVAAYCLLGEAGEVICGFVFALEMLMVVRNATGGVGFK